VQPACACSQIFDAKRLIGRKFADPAVQDDIKHWPFRVRSGAGDIPELVVQYKGEDKVFKAEEISAMVLVKMKDIAQSYLSDKGEVKKAVITVRRPLLLSFDLIGSVRVFVFPDHVLSPATLALRCCQTPHSTASQVAIDVRLWAHASRLSLLTTWHTMDDAF
jgi:Hsp70 protein